jgi:hypothetical protein
MWIGLSGTKWTGKSATIDRVLATYPGELEIIRLGELVRTCPYPIQQHQTLAASAWVTNALGEILGHERREALLLFDRCPVDVLAYTAYASDLAGGASYDKIAEQLLAQVSNFTRVGLCRPSIGWPWGAADAGLVQHAALMERYYDKVVERFSLSVQQMDDVLDDRADAVVAWFDGETN